MVVSSRKEISLSREELQSIERTNTFFQEQNDKHEWPDVVGE